MCKKRPPSSLSSNKAAVVAAFMLNFELVGLSSEIVWKYKFPLSTLWKFEKEILSIRFYVKSISEAALNFFWAEIYQNQSWIKSVFSKNWFDAKTDWLKNTKNFRIVYQ